MTLPSADETPTEPDEEPVVEPVTISISYPVPDPYMDDGTCVLTFDGEYVTMPEWYWLEIVDYINFTSDAGQ